MKIGDLVKLRSPWKVGGASPSWKETEEGSWVGIVIDYQRGEPVVYWNEKFPKEIEYKEQLTVVEDYFAN